MKDKEGSFAVLYRWRVKEGSENAFAKAWLEVTDNFLKNFGSLGSRLHKGNDGLYYAYAVWPSREARDQAFFDSQLESAAESMRETSVERLPEIELEIVADRLKH